MLFDVIIMWSALGGRCWLFFVNVLRCFSAFFFFFFNDPPPPEISPLPLPAALPIFLPRAGPLRAVPPQDGQPIRAGTISVAPPDYHLVVKPGRVRVTRGPRENRHRPAEIGRAHV